MNKIHKQYSKVNLLEELPNRNIFQTENEYKMLQDLRFEQEEKNCRNNLITRFTEIIPVLIVIMILRNSFFLYTEFGTIPKMISLIRIPVIILLNFLLFFSIKNNNQIIEESDLIRMILEIDNVLNIMATACKIEDDPSFFLIAVNYTLGQALNFLFSLNMKTCLLYNTLETIVLFAFCNHPESYFFIRFFKNIFSKNIFKILFLNFFAIVLQYSMSKGIRELWALYDSFKRGYFAFKSIYDEFPYPIFVLNAKKQNYSATTQSNLSGSNSTYNYQIYYKNNEAENLFTQIRLIKDKNFDVNKRNSNKKECAMKELIDPHVEKLFDNELEKCLNGDSKYFDFPLIIGDKKITFKENKNFCTLFEGDLHKIKWVKIYASSCAWRSNEAVILQIMDNEDLQNSLLNNEYGANLDKELSTLIENLDVICDKSPDLNLMKEIEKKNTPLIKKTSGLNQNGSNTPNILRSPSPSNQLYKNMMEVKQKQYIASSPQSFLFINKGLNLKASAKSRLILPKNNNLNLPKNNFNSIISNNSNNSVANLVAKEQKSGFDYTILFMLKHSLNYIQDFNLTINVIIALRMNKILHKQTKMNFENFIPHIVDYLYPIAKMKNFEFKLNLIHEDIVVVYEYYRVIFFNTVFFILNNSEDASEKKIEITIDHSRWTDHGNYYETSFVFKDESPIVKYESLPFLLKTLGSQEFKNINLDQFKFIDGLIVASYLLSNVHNNEFEIETIARNTYKIHFCIFGGAVNNVEVNSPSKVFSRSKSQNIEQLFYDRLLDKTNMKSTDSRNETQDKAKRSNEKPKSDKTVLETNGKKPVLDEAPDEYYPEHEKNVKIENDFNLYKEILMSLSIIDIGHKLIQQTSKEDKMELIKQRSTKLHWVNKSIIKLTGFAAKWDNSHMQEIKYCPIPRFLIVEDNIYGRLSMKDELRKLELAFQYDVATDGREAVEKFKILLNQGYLFDFIFMDIFLFEMDGVEATNIIREIEQQYNCHSNIVAVTLEGKQQIQEGLFDEYFEKPIKNSEKFFSYISTHFGMNRPGTKLKKIR